MDEASEHTEDSTSRGSWRWLGWGILGIGCCFGFFDCSELSRLSAPASSVAFERRPKSSELIEAIRLNQIDRVQRLLDRGVDPNSSGRLGQSEPRLALELAVDLDREPIVRALLNHGAEINGEGGFGGTALHAAAVDGFENLVHLLLENGANVNVEDDGVTPLQYAVNQYWAAKDRQTRARFGHICNELRAAGAISF